MSTDTALLIADLRSYSGEIFACRICHEEDFQRLEIPCACSGTVQFAHRDCIQRWCDEKGNTTCEICLECVIGKRIHHARQRNCFLYVSFLANWLSWTIIKLLSFYIFCKEWDISSVLPKFEPGYTAPPQKTQLNDTTVTIRVSLEDSRTGADQQNDEEILETAADKSAAYCRSVALVFTAMLLIRNVYVVLAIGMEGYPFSLITVLIVKISGILFPMYILFRIFTALLDSVRHHSQNPEMGI